MLEKPYIVKFIKTHDLVWVMSARNYFGKFETLDVMGDYATQIIDEMYRDYEIVAVANKNNYPNDSFSIMCIFDNYEDKCLFMMKVSDMTVGFNFYDVNVYPIKKSINNSFVVSYAP